MGKIPWWGSILNITLVLFFLGIFAFLSISGNIVIDTMLENFKLRAILLDSITEPDAFKLKEELAKKRYVQAIEYISKETALKTMKAAGEDFMEAMDGQNPFPPVIDIRLKLGYIEPNYIKSISDELLERPDIIEVYYPIKEIENIKANSLKIKIIGGILGLVLVIIAILLIMNSIRLAIYSKRFVIRTMQLIGATEQYIRKPFLRIGFLQGLVGGILSSMLIFLTLILLNVYSGDNLRLLLWSVEIQVLYLGIILLGAILGYFSSLMAVNRFLNKTLDQLHG